MGENRSGTELIDRLNKARDFFRRKVESFPRKVVVLGSGMSSLLDDMSVEFSCPYSDIPNCYASGVAGHRARLVVGELAGERIACMQGRLHFYEGIPIQEVVFPFRALAWSGADKFVLTAACGSLREDFQPLDLVLIRDHINLMGTNPLMGPNADELGPRFPDMGAAYDSALREVFRGEAQSEQIELKEGVYIAGHGPSYETPTEVKLFRMWGADVTGMSTVPETLALRHMGKRVVAIGCVTNLASGLGEGILTHCEVVENAEKMRDKLGRLIKKALPKL